MTFLLYKISGAKLSTGKTEQDPFGVLGALNEFFFISQYRFLNVRV